MELATKVRHGSHDRKIGWAVNANHPADRSDLTLSSTTNINF